MLSLHLFGGLRASLNGEPLTGRVAHRKRLAILALLGTATTRSLSRDKLAALLWPEFDAERSRHQLATAVYELRKTASEELVLAVGDDLRLNPALVECDVWSFEALIANGEPGRAVGHYAGPLLDGFYIREAAEFERWVESERGRLSSLYATALERLASGAEEEGDVAAAIGWWRLLAVQDPYSARIAIRLMNALVTAGDVAAAIRHAGVHGALLREELGLQASPEVVALADRLRTSPPADSRPAASRSAADSAPQTLAVLPLRNDTGDPAQEHFADAMTDALIAELARQCSLRVISQTSVMPFKDPDGRKLPDIARELKADVVMEGSVIRDGERVRITAQVVHAGTDEDVWAESYDGTIREILTLQGQVARAVARQVSIHASAQWEDLRESVVRPVDPGAYEAYLRGRQSSGTKSIEALQQAIQIDPDFAPAYATLADRLALQGFFGFDAPHSAFEKARGAALQALASGAPSAEAHGALGIVLLHHDWNWTEAERHFRHALELNPSNAYLRHMFAHQLLAHGQTAESARQSALAAELDPFNAGLMACCGWHGLADGQYEYAATESLRALRISPEFFWPEMILGWAYEQQGRYPEALAAFQDAVSHSGGSSFALAAQAHAHAVAGEERPARRILAELHRRSETGYVSAYEIAAVHAGLGENDEALRWLERAYVERSSFLINLAWEPRFRGLHSDPRFLSIARRIGLAPLQRPE